MSLNAAELKELRSRFERGIELATEQQVEHVLDRTTDKLAKLRKSKADSVKLLAEQCELLSECLYDWRRGNFKAKW